MPAPTRQSLVVGQVAAFSVRPERSGFLLAREPLVIPTPVANPTPSFPCKRESRRFRPRTTHSQFPGAPAFAGAAVCCGAVQKATA